MLGVMETPIHHLPSLDNYSRFLRTNQHEYCLTQQVSSIMLGTYLGGCRDHLDLGQVERAGLIWEPN